MRARDVMTTNIVSIDETTSVEEIARILIEHRISAVPVTDSNAKVVGIVSEGDLAKHGYAFDSVPFQDVRDVFKCRGVTHCDHIARHDVPCPPAMTLDVFHGLLLWRQEYC